MSAPTVVAPDATTVGEKMTARAMWALAITSVAVFMVTLDNLVVTTAIPERTGARPVPPHSRFGRQAALLRGRRRPGRGGVLLAWWVSRKGCALLQGWIANATVCWEPAAAAWCRVRRLPRRCCGARA
jgi:hypothetical protein